MPQGDSLAEELSLKGCRRLFIDGGSNQGGGVEEFYKGSYYRCAISAPARLYGKPWHNASRQVKQQWTQPLASSDWCVRSFEANPKLLPMLQRKEREHRSQGRDVRFIDGVLGTVSGSAVPRTIVTYSKDPAGSGASRFDFRRVHSGSPPLLSSEEYLGRGYDIREIIRRMHELNPTAQVALRLDVEGDELFIHKALLETAGADLGVGDGSLLCHVDWMFTEHHNLHVNLTEYGLPERGYNVIGDRIHDAMNTRGCHLKINWRNFWSACGGHARYVWSSKTPQATGMNESERIAAQVAKSALKKKATGKMRGRRRLALGQTSSSTDPTWPQ